MKNYEVIFRPAGNGEPEKIVRNYEKAVLNLGLPYRFPKDAPSDEHTLFAVLSEHGITVGGEYPQDREPKIVARNTDVYTMDDHYGHKPGGPRMRIYRFPLPYSEGSIEFPDGTVTFKPTDEAAPVYD